MHSSRPGPKFGSEGGADSSAFKEAFEAWFAARKAEGIVLPTVNPLDLLHFVALEQAVESILHLPQVKAQIGSTDAQSDVSGFKDMLCPRKPEAEDVATNSTDDDDVDDDLDDDDDGGAEADTSGIAGGAAVRYGSFTTR